MGSAKDPSWSRGVFSVILSGPRRRDRKRARLGTDYTAPCPALAQIIEEPARAETTCLPLSWASICKRGAVVFTHAVQKRLRSPDCVSPAGRAAAAGPQRGGPSPGNGKPRPRCGL